MHQHSAFHFPSPLQCQRGQVAEVKESSCCFKAIATDDSLSLVLHAAGELAGSLGLCRGCLA